MYRWMHSIPYIELCSRESNTSANQTSNEVMGDGDIYPARELAVFRKGVGDNEIISGVACHRPPLGEHGKSLEANGMILGPVPIIA